MRADETTRKLVHALVGLSPPLVVWAIGWRGGVAAALFALAYLVLASDANRRGVFLPLLAAPWMTRGRDGVNGLWDGVLFMFAVAVVGLLFPLPYFFGAAALLGVGDAAASIAGRRPGGHPLPWNPRKTWEGFLAGTLLGVPAASSYAVLGGLMTRQGFDRGRSLLGDAWPWTPLLLFAAGFGILLLFFTILIANGWAPRYANATPARVAAMLGIALALPAAWLLTAPALVPHALIPLVGGHGPVTRGLLLLVPVPVMWVESRINRRDNLWVPGLYAALAYGVAFVGDRL